MAAIEWIDGEGAGSLSNLKQAPANRFTNWTPNAAPIGPAVVPPGTGLTHRFRFRTDYLVYLEIVGIPGSAVESMLRARLHLMNGGLVNVTGAEVHPSYERFGTAALAPGTEPEIRFSDKTRREYTFAVTLKALTSPTASTGSLEGITVEAGQYITIEVFFAECSGDPETLTMDGPISGKMFEGTQVTLVGQKKTFGPVPATGVLTFLAWHQIFASGPIAHVTWDTPGGPYTALIDDGFGDFDYNDIELIVTVSSAPPLPVTTMDPIPSNNAYQWRKRLVNSGDSYTDDNTGATMETGEPDVSGTLEGSLWYVWRPPYPDAVTATIDTLATVDTGLDTVIAVYKSSNELTFALDTLVLVASNDNATGTLSSVSFTTDPTVRGYLVQVGTKTGTPRGEITTTISTAPIAPPPTDDFASRVTISGATGSVNGNNAAATSEVGEPNPGWGIGQTLWCEWVAPADGVLLLECIDPVTGGNAYAAVYTGSTLGSLVQVTGGRGFATCKVTSGTSYKIQLDTLAAGSDIQLDWSMPTPPANDDFANAQVITGSSGSTTVDNTGATQEVGEPKYDVTFSANTVWFDWTAPSSGTVQIDTWATSPELDTFIGVYTGSALGALTFKAQNDNFTGHGRLSKVSFAVVAGTSYKIYVGTQAFAGLANTGPITLSWSLA